MLNYPRFLVLLVLVVPAFIGHGAFAASAVRADVACPEQPLLESCRWEIQVNSLRRNDAPLIQVGWEKSLVSRHREKPLASPIQCNVDREFDMPAGGYIRVWFKGDAAPCDPMRQRNPAVCGVRFLLDTPGDLTSARGFEVAAPTGKQLEKVEHLSTLKIQCGNFARTDYAKRKWRSLVGWRAEGTADAPAGTYSENRTPTVDED